MSVLEELAERREGVLSGIQELGDMRRGSVVEQYYETRLKDGTLVKRGPYYLYTYKDKGKTVSRRLAGPAEVERYEEQIGRFRRFEELSAQLIEVSHEICDAKDEAEANAIRRQKKRRR